MLETPQIAPNAKNGTMATYGDDKNSHAIFSQEAVLNDFRSNEEGHPSYDNVIMLEIMTPGAKTTFKTVVKDEEAGHPYSDRFPNQWKQFKAQQEQVSEGMPLTEWPVINKAQALNLKANGIHTVEQLASVIDQNLGILGLGGRELRDKAKTYINRAIDASEITKIHAELAVLRADNAAMKEMLSTPLNVQAGEEKPKTLKLKG